MSDSANFKVLPPLIPLAAVSTGSLIHFLAPIQIFSSAILQFVGIGLIIVSILIVALAVKALANAKTRLTSANRPVFWSLLAFLTIPATPLIYR